MTQVDVTVYFNALNLLTDEKPNLLEEVKNVFYHTDYYTDKLVDDMCDMYSDFMEIYERNMENIDFVDYLKLSKQGPSYNHNETMDYNTSTIAFDIPCDFDDEAFVKNLLELDNEKQVKYEEDEKEL